MKNKVFINYRKKSKPFSSFCYYTNRQMCNYSEFYKSIKILFSKKWNLQHILNIDSKKIIEKC